MATNPTPEQVALVRRRYREGASVQSIMIESGIANLAMLYGCIDGRFDDGSGSKPARLPRRRPGVRVRRGPRRERPEDRAALVERLWHSAARQVEQIDARLMSMGLKPEDYENSARVLATMVRMLRDLSAFDNAERAHGRLIPSADDDDDPVPANIDEFREELARRINALVDARTGRRGAGESG